MILQILAVAMATIGLMVILEAIAARQNQRKPQTLTVVMASLIGVAFLITLLYAGGEL